MSIPAFRPHRGLACCVALVAAFVLSISGSAAAKPVAADLRVEAGGDALTDARYITGKTRIKTDPGAKCFIDGIGGSGRTVEFSDPNALGIVKDALGPDRDLRPLSVTDEYDFGLGVCGIGGFIGSASRFWGHVVNHKDPMVAADTTRLRRNDEVLWYFADSSSGANTGDELELRAPVRVRTGEAFEVTVVAYTKKGVARPASGANVASGGGGSKTTDSAGKATFTAGKEGTVDLRATRGADIPSAAVEVCVNKNLDRCARKRGKRIFGTKEKDKIKGTPGPDRVKARAGNDRIKVRRGGADEVNCGSGRDKVKADEDDRISSNCEKVRIR